MSSPLAVVNPLRWVYAPTADEMVCAYRIAKRRNRFNNGGSTNLPNDTVFGQARLKLAYFGALAEIALARMVNRCWSGCGPGAIDKAIYDVGNAIEVRSISKPDRGLLAHWRDRPEPPYVLVYVDPKTKECRALGWATYAEVKARGRVLHPDDRPAWVLAQEFLRPMDGLPLPD